MHLPPQCREERAPRPRLLAPATGTTKRPRNCTGATVPTKTKQIAALLQHSGGRTNDQPKGGNCSNLHPLHPGALFTLGHFASTSPRLARSGSLQAQLCLEPCEPCLTFRSGTAPHGHQRRQEPDDRLGATIIRCLVRHFPCPTPSEQGGCSPRRRSLSPAAACGLNGVKMRCTAGGISGSS